MAKFNIDMVEAKTMHGLKDFQRATVERIDYLFRNGQNRVLVADEVGMGKTLIARGAIVKTARMRLEQQDELMKVIMGLSDEEIALLESAYGKKPNNKYGTLAMLKSAYANKDIFQQRCDALEDMLTTNPFAVRTFVDLVMVDVWSPDPILLWYIYDDLLLPE